MTDEQNDKQSEAELTDVEGIVRGDDGLLRVKMIKSANAARIPDEYR